MWEFLFRHSADSEVGKQFCGRAPSLIPQHSKNKNITKQICNMCGKSWRSCELRIDGGPLLKLGWGRHPFGRTNLRKNKIFSESDRQNEEKQTG